MPVLRVENLQATALTGPISFQCEPGECVVISGASGSGKSLLLRAVADLIPHEGHVSLGDKNCLDISACDWRRQVGLLPAESAWWSDKVADHFCGCDTHLLDDLGLPVAAMEWKVRRCSTGERQRLALARLLCRSPQVLLLDEPTASLDPEGVQRVEALIERYRHEHAIPVLWVSHDPAQIERVADRQFVMVAGQLQGEVA